MKRTLTLLLFAFSSVAIAEQTAKPEDLLAKVIDTPNGKAEASLTGPLADNLRSVTHSTAQPRIKFENLGKIGGCYKINQTLTVPNVPDTSNRIVGDWVMVTRLNICKDNVLPPGMKAQEPLSCTIGGSPCGKAPSK